MADAGRMSKASEYVHGLSGLVATMKRLMDVHFDISRCKRTTSVSVTSAPNAELYLPPMDWPLPTESWRQYRPKSRPFDVTDPLPQTRTRA